jgi:hypothetical protein
LASDEVIFASKVWKGSVMIGWTNVVLIHCKDSLSSYHWNRMMVHMDDRCDTGRCDDTGFFPLNNRLLYNQWPHLHSITLECTTSMWVTFRTFFQYILQSIPLYPTLEVHTNYSYVPSVPSDVVSSDVVVDELPIDVGHLSKKNYTSSPPSSTGLPPSSLPYRWVSHISPSSYEDEFVRLIIGTHSIIPWLSIHLRSLSMDTMIRLSSVQITQLHLPVRSVPHQRNHGPPPSLSPTWIGLRMNHLVIEWDAIHLLPRFVPFLYVQTITLSTKHPVRISDIVNYIAYYYDSSWITSVSTLVLRLTHKPSWTVTQLIQQLDRLQSSLSSCILSTLWVTTTQHNHMVDRNDYVWLQYSFAKQTTQPDFYSLPLPPPEMLAIRCKQMDHSYPELKATLPCHLWNYLCGKPAFQWFDTRLSHGGH